MLIHKKMVEALREFDAIKKSQKNQSQGYLFRGIDQFMNEAHRVFSSVGIFVVPEVLENNFQVVEVVRSGGKTALDKIVNLRVRFSFFSEDGSSVSAIAAGEGIDSGDKATNKAMSAALKYCLAQTFLIPTEDVVDADKETPQISSLSDKIITYGKYAGKKFVEIETQELIEYCKAESTSKDQKMISFINDARQYCMTKRGN